MNDVSVFDASDVSLASLREAFGDRLETSPAASLHVRFLDTFDWRLHDAGCRLACEEERGRGTLTWSSPQQIAPYSLPVDRAPRFVSDLPDGFLRSILEPIVEVRALLPLGAAVGARQPAVVRNRNGNTVARLCIDELRLLDSENQAEDTEHRVITIHRVSPKRTELRRVTDTLAAVGATAAEGSFVFRAAAAVRGRSPGDYRSKPQLALRVDQRSDTAVRAILEHLRGVVAANVTGVIADVDSEFLHDLRVAVRRARSLLGQMKGVLPESDTLELVTGLKWLGTASNRCRDLDVYLLELEGYRRQLGEQAAAIDVLEAAVRRDRRGALQRLRNALRSRRFAELLERWSAVANSTHDAAAAENATRPVGDLASARIRRAYKRMARRGRGLGSTAEAEALHRLRIDAKKLRYLLEFFASLYPEPVMKQLVKELKALQDVLGGFNDMTVQQRHLSEMAERLLASGAAGAEALLAMGRLTATMQERQDALHSDFAARFAEFSSPESRDLYAATFGGT